MSNPFDVKQVNQFLQHFTKESIQLIHWLEPKITRIDSQTCDLMIPLSERSKNHLGSMYFGALATGADAAAGIYIFAAMQALGANLNLVFKDFHAEFMQRPVTDVVFSCHDGEKITQLVTEAAKTKQRTEGELKVIATTPSTGDDPIAVFTLTASLKVA